MKYTAEINEGNLTYWLEADSLRTVYEAVRHDVRYNRNNGIRCSAVIRSNESRKVVYEEYTNSIDFAIELDLPVRAGYSIEKEGVFSTVDLHSLMGALSHGYRSRYIGKLVTSMIRKAYEKH